MYTRSFSNANPILVNELQSFHLSTWLDIECTMLWCKVVVEGSKQDRESVRYEIE